MFWQYFLERALALRIDEKLGGEGRHREQAVPPMTRSVRCSDPVSDDAE